MVEEKGLSGEAADRIGEFVQMSGGQVRRKIITWIKDCCLVFEVGS